MPGRPAQGRRVRTGCSREPSNQKNSVRVAEECATTCVQGPVPVAAGAGRGSGRERAQGRTQEREGPCPGRVPGATEAAGPGKAPARDRGPECRADSTATPPSEGSAKRKAWGTRLAKGGTSSPGRPATALGLEAGAVPQAMGRRWGAARSPECCGTGASARRGVGHKKLNPDQRLRGACSSPGLALRRVTLAGTGAPLPSSPAPIRSRVPPPGPVHRSDNTFRSHLGTHDSFVEKYIVFLYSKYVLIYLHRSLT